MQGWALPAAIGFASGVLSGLFGIGGGVITTPAIRLLLGAPAIIAVGTPLPVIIPSAATGAVVYARHRIADVRSGVMLGLAGSLTSVAGAAIAEKIGGSAVMVGTSALLVYAAGDMLQQVLGSPKAAASGDATAGERARMGWGAIAGIGAVTGLYSGLFGLGGGFVLVPMLSRWAKMPVKRAIGTSLVAVTILAVPGTIAHSYAGNVDWPMAFSLMLGVVPGALLGARITMGAADRPLRVAFAALLIVSAVWLILVELGGWA
jgi:uncharacterized membrane protein YfcA